MISINIDLGPKIVWLSILFCGAFWTYFTIKLGRAWERIDNTRDVQKRTLQLTMMPHIAPGQPLRVLRVDPRSGIIGERWREEEDELAA